MKLLFIEECLINNLSINYNPDYKQYDDSNDETICSMYLDGYSTTDIAIF